MIYEQLQLYSTTEKFIIQPVDGNEILVIDKQTTDVSVTADRSIVPTTTGTQPTTIYGLWGIIRLPPPAGPQLLTIRSRALVGNLWGHNVWRVDATDVLPFQRLSASLSPQQASDAAAYLAMVQEVLKTPNYYFSYTLDVTHSAQRLADTSPEFRSLALAERADERFVWNHQLLGDLRGFSRFALPIMHGFVSIWSSVYRDRAFDYALISRRSRFRAGVRFYMRGADENGCVANFVETEQLVQAQGQKFSFVVTRGSVPLSWSQYPNLKYKPKPDLAKEAHLQTAVFSAHFNDQVFTHRYGKQIVINLLDTKGAERELCASFSRSCSQPELLGAAEVRYEHFDFHKECSRMRWDRLSLLMDRTEPDHQAMGYFHIAADGSVALQQKSVFRVNCIDCLDRTNVVQGMLARRALLDQFRSLGWLEDGANGRLSDDVERFLKNVWADNADTLAQQYTGTGALKADFTRTGKRTKYGALMDGYNSMVRYAKNNFTDGFRQDAIDLFLGNYQPEPGAASPFEVAAESASLMKRALPAAALIGLALLVMRILLPAERWTDTALHCLIFIGLIALSLFGIVRHGDEFVDRPRLALKIDRQKKRQ
ncbi:hypothetical protein BOX15_Mlig027473g1 [Macrostomum lignano]|uniref:Phosphatidylinositol-3-phosphatase SAC1 n=2 Tax=Macrostomum lignano TaxID=282301 RepID=A0A1I8ICI8_9PLAT|nr:hypothetical protein BOX15_Mlig027473g1 [Macrostomum lignano]